MAKVDARLTEESGSATPSFRSILVWILPALSLTFWYGLSAWRAAGAIGFPLDDSWIHAQFARNLAQGRGFTFTVTGG